MNQLTWSGTYSIQTVYLLPIWHSVNSFDLHNHHVGGWHDPHFIDEEIESLVRNPLKISQSDISTFIADSIAWAFLLPICIAGGVLLSDLLLSLLHPPHIGYPLVVGNSHEKVICRCTRVWLGQPQDTVMSMGALKVILVDYQYWSSMSWGYELSFKKGGNLAGSPQILNSLKGKTESSESDLNVLETLPPFFLSFLYECLERDKPWSSEGRRCSFEGWGGGTESQEWCLGDNIPDWWEVCSFLIPSESNAIISPSSHWQPRASVGTILRSFSPSFSCLHFMPQGCRVLRT